MGFVGMEENVDHFELPKFDFVEFFIENFLLIENSDFVKFNTKTFFVPGI